MRTLALLCIFFLCGCSTVFKYQNIRKFDMPDVYQIEYEFGLDDFGKVIINRHENHFMVYMTGGRNKLGEVIINQEQIILWCFTSLAEELSNSRLTDTKDTYPFIYSIKLLSKDKKEIMKIDSSKKILNNSYLENRLKELRGFLIKLWDTSLNKK